MHMRRSQSKTYSIRKRVPGKDKEGGSIIAWDDAIEIVADIWSASGRIQAQMYGERLAYIKNMLYEGSETLQEGDGICVFVGPESDPDYKIISIKPEFTPAQIELERI